MKKQHRKKTVLCLKGITVAISSFLGLAITFSAVFYMLQYLAKS
ncbi:MAG: hypothetical protein ACYCXI_08705 [Dethiobacteraceae bacterium]|jgi:hypothetical protein